MDEWESILALAAEESRAVSDDEGDDRNSFEGKVTHYISVRGTTSGVSLSPLVKWYSGHYAWHGSKLERHNVLAMATEYLFDTIYDFHANPQVDSILYPCYNHFIETQLADIVKSRAQGRIPCSEIPDLNSLAKEGIIVSFTEVGTVDAVDTKEETQNLREVPVEIELVLHGHPNGLEVIVKVIEDDHRDALRRFKSIALEAVLKGARIIRSKTCFGGRGLRKYVDGTISGAYESIAVDLARDARVPSILYEFCDTYVRRKDYKMENSSIVYEPSDIDWLTRGRVDNGRYSLSKSVGAYSDYWLENRKDDGGERIGNSEATIVADYLRAVYKTGISMNTNSSGDSRLVASKMIRAISDAKDGGIPAEELHQAGADRIIDRALVGAVYKENMLDPEILNVFTVDTEFYSALLAVSRALSGDDAEELVAYSLFSADCKGCRHANLSKRRIDYMWALEDGIVQREGVQESRGINREEWMNDVVNKTVGGEYTTEKIEHYATDKIYSTLDGTNIQLTDRMVGDLSNRIHLTVGRKKHWIKVSNGLPRVASGAIRGVYESVRRHLGGLTVFGNALGMYSEKERECADLLINAALKDPRNPQEVKVLWEHVISGNIITSNKSRNCLIKLMSTQEEGVIINPGLDTQLLGIDTVLDKDGKRWAILDQCTAILVSGEGIVRHAEDKGNVPSFESRDVQGYILTGLK